MGLTYSFYHSIFLQSVFIIFNFQHKKRRLQKNNIQSLESWGIGHFYVEDVLCRRHSILFFVLAWDTLTSSVIGTFTSHHSPGAVNQHRIKSKLGFSFIQQNLLKPELCVLHPTRYWGIYTQPRIGILTCLSSVWFPQDNNKFCQVGEGMGAFSNFHDGSRDRQLLTSSEGWGYETFFFAL